MRRRILLALLIAAPGCANLQKEAEVRDLRARLEAVEHAREGDARRLDQLDGRLFLLTDQLESQKVAMNRRAGPPPLPVVTLRPSPEPGPPPAEGTAPEALAERPRPGAARSRPMLRLEGTPVREEARPAVAAAPPVDPAKLPNLGVVRLGDRGIVAKPREVVGGDPAAEYQAAHGLLMAGRHDEAAAALREFVRRHPAHDYADNAQYWLGETFYARKDYTRAAPEFQTVVVRWPSGNKAPDAMLKLGYCLLSLGDVAQGRGVLTKVAEHYPRTEAAQLAERRLAELPRSEAMP